MGKKLALTLVTTGVVLLCAVLQLASVTSGLELKALDWRMRFFGTAKPSPDIVIVEIDENTLKSLKWPLERKYYLTLLGIMEEWGAQATAFDLVFADPSANDPSSDTLLSQISQEQANIFHSYYFTDKTASSNIPEPRLAARGLKITDSTQGYVRCSNPLLPFPLLFEKALNLGHINLTEDPDGVFRRVPLTVEYGGYSFASLALKMAMTTPKIPTDLESRMLVNFTSGFQKHALIQVLQSYKAGSSGERTAIGLRDFKNKYVFVGNTAASLGDYGPTSMGSNEPKVMVHVNALNTILSRHFLVQANPYINFLLLILIAAAMALSCGMLGVMRAVKAACGLLILNAVINIILFRQGWVINLSLTSLGGVLSFIAASVYLGLVREVEHFRLEKAIGKYVSPAILGRIKDGHARLRGTTGDQVMTLLFSDVKGFSSLFDVMDHQVIYNQVTEYLEEMAGIILAHDGSVDKFMGDGVMAYFGANGQPYHAALAVHVASEMQNRMVELRKKWLQEGKAQFQIRIGVNTGMVTIGDMGSENFSDYTVFGNSVNLAQRLESNATPDKILVSQTTYEASKEYYDFLYAGPKKVKGINMPVETWEVVGPRTGFEISRILNLMNHDSRIGRQKFMP